MKTKKCFKCKRVFPLTRKHFYRHRSRKDGYYCWCKECFKKQQRERYQKLKLEAMNHYGGKCACCEESRIEFLTIDHINNDGGTHRRKFNNRGGKDFYLWLKRNNYPTNPPLQVLCWNCNSSKAYYGYCPHQLAT